MKLAFCAALAVLLLGNARAAEPAAKSSQVNLSGSVQIRNLKFGALLRPENANAANGTPIVLYPAQPWKCMTWKLEPAGESAYHLQNHFTSKTFAPNAKAGQTAAVIQVPFPKEPAARPVWHMTKLPDGSYRISDPKTGNVLTAVKEGDGVKIRVQSWQDTDGQKWQLLPLDPSQLTM